MGNGPGPGQVSNLKMKRGRRTPCITYSFSPNSDEDRDSKSAEKDSENTSVGYESAQDQEDEGYRSSTSQYQDACSVSNDLYDCDNIGRFRPKENGLDDRYNSDKSKSSSEDNTGVDDSDESDSRFELQSEQGKTDSDRNSEDSVVRDEEDIDQRKLKISSRISRCPFIDAEAEEASSNGSEATQTSSPQASPVVSESATESSSDDENPAGIAALQAMPNRYYVFPV